MSPDEAIALVRMLARQGIALLNAETEITHLRLELVKAREQIATMEAENDIARSGGDQSKNEAEDA